MGNGFGVCFKVMNDVELIPTNLAFMGAMDDFYNLYCEIKVIYETHRKLYIRENGKKCPLLSKTWDELCLKDVRKRIEPLLNKYIHLFTNDYDRVFARSYAFQNFSFINRDKTFKNFDGESPFILSFISFSDFLIEFQIIITMLNYRENFSKNPEHSVQKSWLQINEKIRTLTKEKRSECETLSNTIPASSDILYIFDKLSSISCYKKDHPIISARYVAVVAKTAKKISLPVHYCDYCKKYFIGAKTLAIFEKNFGKLIIDKKDISEMETEFGCFNAESKLHSLGYNVIKGRLSADEREQLLIYLLENRLITYVELCSTIEQNINIFKRSHSHRFAVEKWENDLKAIGKYILKHPEKKDYITLTIPYKKDKNNE